MDLEPLNTLAELSWESRCKIVDDIKNCLEPNNPACLDLSSKNFVQPLTKFLSTAHEIHDIRALRAGLQLLLSCLRQNRSGIQIQYLNEDAFCLLSLFQDSKAKEVLDIIELLSHRTSCRPKIAASGAIASLCNILDFNSTDFTKQVIKILRKLSSTDDVFTSLVHLECIPKLISFLNDPALANYVIILLRNLCNNKEAKLVHAETNGAIDSVVELLETGSNKDQERAVAVLLGLCSESVQFCEWVMDKSIPALVAVSINGSEKAQASAMELLRFLGDIHHDDHEQESFQSDSVHF